jgi:hypothetical protein
MLRFKDAHLIYKQLMRHCNELSSGKRSLCLQEARQSEFMMQAPRMWMSLCCDEPSIVNIYVFDAKISCRGHQCVMMAAVAPEAAGQWQRSPYRFFLHSLRNKFPPCLSRRCKRQHETVINSQHYLCFSEDVAHVKQASHPRPLAHATSQFGM